MNRVTAISLNLILGSTVVLGQFAPPTVLLPVQVDVSPELSNIALNTPNNPVPAPSEVIQKHGPLIGDVGEPQAGIQAPLAPVIQNSPGPPFQGVVGQNFEGLGSGFPGYAIFVAPPDTTMAVGPNHIVQWVNLHIAVFNKTGTPLLSPPGFVAGNSIWSGFGGLCESANRGDPVVLYDRMADRWVLSQFAFNVGGSPSRPMPPYLQCFAVSTSGNPMGSYSRYAYSFVDGSANPIFNDYGKMGVWPDAYYQTYNIFENVNLTNTGASICAFNRAAMIAGSPTAAAICFGPAFFAGGASFLPTDIDGPTPPLPGAPNPIMRYSFGGIPLRYMKFHVDFFTPANSTLNNGFGGATGTFIDLGVSPTTVACNGAAGNCIPQPGTANTLDTLADRLMYRLAYRNRSGAESLTVSQSVDTDGAGPIASQVRWYEVRNPFATTPSLFQNATFAPDTTNRWMPSVAMDKVGNMAVGYSVSSGSVFPSIRVTGRLRSELRNRMQNEFTVVAGTGSQTGTLTRWGDYSTMQVDPSDDCTFWYTTEYIGANGTFNWRTRLFSFKFPACQ